MEFVDRERKQIMSNHLIDIDKDAEHDPLLDSMEKEFQSLSPISSECVIYRVPERLRHVKEKAYTPKAVSIGPLHHGSENLRAMEEHKMRYLQDFIGRSTEKSLEFFLGVVRKNEAKLRDCYAETIPFSRDEFVKIILVDAAFVVEVLLKSFNRILQKENDRIFNKPWLIQDVWTDMLLLENQLPFFILEDLFNSYKDEVLLLQYHTKRLTISMVTEMVFKDRMETKGIKQRWEEISSGKVKLAHFVDLLRHLQLPLSKSNDQMKLKKLTTPSITQLYLAGVKFEVAGRRLESTPNRFDIKFSNGKLVIPNLILSDETELIIRNSLAFEQCHYTEPYINDYVILMSQLVGTSKDVDLLVKSGIVENRLNNSVDGSIVLNNLADGAVLDQNNFYFCSLFDELNVYFGTSRLRWKATWHKWMVFLNQKYFGRPWAIISLLGAVVLLILTIIQTVCSVISARHPSN